MPLTRVETKVLFAAANSVTITSGATNTSDIVTLDPTCVDASITLKADNQGTTVSGDTVTVFVLLSSGDPDGAAVADEYASADSTHARRLGTIDTFVTDPGLITFPYPKTPVKGKLYAVNNGASSVIFSAVVEEQRG